MKKLALQCLCALLVSIGVSMVGSWLNPAPPRNDVFAVACSYSLFGTIVFFIGYTALGVSNKLANWKFASYLLAIVATSTAFYFWGYKWGIGRTQWGHPGLATAFVFTVFVALNIFFWRILFKLTALRAYLFSFFMGAADMLVCFMGMPLVK